MFFIRLFITLFFISTLSNAQTNPTRFRNDIENAKSDTALLQVYRNIFDYYKESNNDSSSHYLQEGLKTFTEHNYLPGKAAMLGMLSSTYSSEGMVVYAKQTADACLKIYTQLHDQNGIAKIRNVIGVIEGQSNHYDNAVKNFLLALKYFEKVSDTANIVNTYIKIGKANDIGGSVDTALAYFQKALSLSLKIKPTANTAYLYNNIASSYAKKKNYGKVLENLKKALVYSQDPRYAFAKVYTLTNLGNFYVDKDQLDVALKYYKEGLKIAEQGKMKEEYVILMSHIGMIESLQENQISNNQNKALILAREMGNQDVVLGILNDMIQVSEKNKNYKDEVGYLKQANLISDSIFTLKQSREIANLQSGYELNKSKKQLAALEKSELANSHKKNIIIVIAIILLCTLMTLFAFFIRSMHLNKKLSIREKELENANNVKDRLFSIIGHDLKGPIGNFSSLINIYKSEDTSEEEKDFILNSLEENSIATFDTLEKLLHWGKLQIKGNTLNKTVFNADEKMNNMLQLLKVAAENKQIQFHNKISPDIRLNADEHHFKFVMRNLLSNAVKYTRTGGVIEIQATENANDNFVTFAVKDNGIGIDKERQEHIFQPYNNSTAGTDDELGTSIGLMLCKEFVEVNGGTIWLDSEQGVGTTFYFTMMKA